MENNLELKPETIAAAEVKTETKSKPKTEEELNIKKKLKKDPIQEFLKKRNEENGLIYDVVVMRADGLSYESIARKLNKSKAFVIKNCKMNQMLIYELKNDMLQEILRVHKVSQEEQVNRIAKELAFAWDNFSMLKYDELSKKEILDIITKLEKKLADGSANMKKYIDQKDASSCEYQVEWNKLDFIETYDD